MIKTALAIALALAPIEANAAARSYQMSAEFGGPPGLTTMANGPSNQQWLQGQQANNTSVINFPSGTVLTDCGGTITLKQWGEIYIQLVIDGTPVRAMEFITRDMGSWVFNFPVPSSWTPGQAYLNFSYINSTSAANPGAGVEYQIACEAQ